MRFRVGDKGGQMPAAQGFVELEEMGTTSLGDYLFRQGESDATFIRRELRRQLCDLIAGGSVAPERQLRSSLPEMRGKVEKPIQLAFVLAVDLKRIAKPESFFPAPAIEQHANAFLSAIVGSAKLGMPEKLVPLAKALTDDAALAAWSAFASAIERRAFGTLLWESAGWIEAALEQQRGGGDKGAARYLRMRFDELRERSIMPLLHVQDICTAHRRFVEALTASLGLPRAADDRRWQEVWRRVEGALHDAGDVMGSIENELFTLICFADLSQTLRAPYLRKSIEVLHRYPFRTIKGCVAFVAKLNESRASAHGIAFSIDRLPAMHLREDAGGDLFRILNGLIVRAILAANLAVQTRQISIGALLRAQTLELTVLDNGRGDADTVRLASAMEVAKRRGWKLEVKPQAGVGTEAVLSIDTSDWETRPVPAVEGDDGTSEASSPDATPFQPHAIPSPAMRIR
jgi:hypothetical protein